VASKVLWICLPSAVYTQEDCHTFISVVELKADKVEAAHIKDGSVSYQQGLNALNLHLVKAVRATAE